MNKKRISVLGVFLIIAAMACIGIAVYVLFFVERNVELEAYVPEETPVITATPIPTQEPTPEPTVEPTPTQEPTPVPTMEPTPTPAPTSTPEPTEEPTPEPTEEPTPTPYKTIMPKETEKPKKTKEPTPEPEPTAEPTPSPESAFTPEPKPTRTPQAVAAIKTITKSTTEVKGYWKAMDDYDKSVISVATISGRHVSEGYEVFDFKFVCESQLPKGGGTTYLYLLYFNHKDVITKIDIYNVAVEESGKMSTKKVGYFNKVNGTWDDPGALDILNRYGY